MGARTAEEPGGVTLRVWAGLGSREPGRAGRAQPTASGEEEEGRLARGPEEEGCGGATLGLGNREARGNPPPFGAGRRPATPSGRSASQPGRRGCGERRAHTRAHTLPESMLSAALGTSCRVASRPAPSGPPLPVHRVLSWGRPSARVGGAAPACRRFVPLAPASLLLRSQRCWRLPPPRLGTGVWMSSPVPRGQVRGREARGLAVWPLAWWTHSLCTLRAHRPRAGSRLGERGCVSWGRSRTLAVTHKAVVS